MKRLALAGTLSLAVACTPGVPKGTTQASSDVVARFDPAATPAVVPSPNDLALNPATGKVTIPLGPNPSAADVALQQYFSQLNGFSAGSVASATFTGSLDPSTVTSQNVLVWDVSSGAPVPVSGYAVTVRNNLSGPAAAEVDVSPPTTGWTAGHDYAVVLRAGSNGLKGTSGAPVVGTPTWALIRSNNDIVTCSGASNSNCVVHTNLIPSTQTDPAAKAADQLAKAQQLEALQRMYRPLFQAAEAQGVSRSDIPLLWKFKITTSDILAYNPAGQVPEVPVPNDLAIDPNTHLVTVAPDPRTPAANQEFTTTYLDTLNGFPLATPGAAQVVGPQPLAPASVAANTVTVLDITPSADGGVQAPPAATMVGDPMTNQVLILPPGGAWQRGHQYAVAVVGGPTGIQTGSGTPVLPDAAWVLLGGTNPLVDCTTLSSSCHSVVTAVPLADADAVKLETARRALSPLLDNLQKMGLPRSAVIAAWTFSIVSSEEPTFDPANSIIPFPNDILRVSPADGGAAHVNLPLTFADGGANPQAALIQGLNTLDGFSTLAAIETQNGTATGSLTDDAHFDPSTLGGAQVVKLQGGYSSPIVTPCLSDVPNDAGCAFAFSPLPDGGAGNYPEQLVLVPQAPLDERAQYAAFLTTDMKTTNGKNIAPGVLFGLLRLTNPLVDGNGKSQVIGVTDAQAQQAEPLRQAMQPLFQGLSQAVPRTKLALAWAFTTQTELSALQQLHGVPAAIAQQNPSAPLIPFLQDVTAKELNSTNFPYAGLADGGTAHSVGHIFVGEITTENLTTGPSGTLNPASPAIETSWFTLTIPDAGVPAGGFPVAIFGHGLGQWRGNVMLIADRLAENGIASIAIDDVDHGERSSCVGSAAALPSALTAGLTNPDDAACAVGACDETKTSPTYGKCIVATGQTSLPCTAAAIQAATGSAEQPDFYCYSHRQGFCQNPASKTAACQGGDFRRPTDGNTISAATDPFDATDRPVISGWNFLNTNNLFGTRDAFRQTTVDYAQLALLVSQPAATPGSLNFWLNAGGLGGTVLNASKLYYVGQSLGGITGALYNAVAPETHNVVLNVPGGNLTELFLYSPNSNLAAARAGFENGLAAMGITPGTVAFDQFMRIAQWILDPGDPANAAYGLKHQVANNGIPSDRQALIYYIQNDALVINSTTDALIAASNRPNDTNQCSVVEETPSETAALSTPLNSNNRHGFLLSPPSLTPQGEAFTVGAQSSVADYLSNGTVPKPQSL